MRRRPIWFTTMAVVMGVLALSLPLQIMFIYGHGFDELDAVFTKLTALNWIMAGGFLISTVLFWRVAPVIRIFAPLLVALVAVNNLIVGYYGADFTFWTVNLATLAFISINLPLFDDRIQWLLRHPEKRWWFRAERKRLAIAITIEGTRLEPAKGETFDLSRSGAFVCGHRELGVGDWITLRIRLGALTQIRCQAKVIRRSEAKGIYPAGIGVKFMNLGLHERRELRRYMLKEAPTLEGLG